MATIVNRPGGHKWIQFASPLEPKRCTIRLGKATSRHAGEWKRRVEQVINSIILSAPLDRSTAEWLAGLPPKMRERLANTGLCEPPGPQTLSDLLDEFFDDYSAEEGTIRVMKCVAENLTSHFGESAPILTLNAKKAIKFREWLKEDGGAVRSGLAETTVSMRCQKARQIFKFACDSGWLKNNPFDGMCDWSTTDQSKAFFVTREIYHEIIENTVDVSFRAIIALARIGGLRSPSEIKPLTWDAVDWKKRRLRVTSPKTKRFKDKGERTIPLFPELGEQIEQLWEVAKEGEPRMFPSDTISSAGLNSKLQSVLRACGIPLWPKPFINMRASRDSELLEQYPIHVVATWMGHSARIALKHYAQVQEVHWDAAVAENPSDGETTASPPNRDTKAK